MKKANNSKANTKKHNLNFKRIFKIILIILGVFCLVTALDCSQALLFNNNLIFSIKWYNKNKDSVIFSNLFLASYNYCDGTRVIKSPYEVSLGSGHGGCNFKDEIEKMVKENNVDTYPEGFYATASIIEDLYNNGAFDETTSYTSALIIEKVTGCNVAKEFNTTWEKAEDFYELWRKSECRKENYEKYHLKEGRFEDFSFTRK